MKNGPSRLIALCLLIVLPATPGYANEPPHHAAAPFTGRLFFSAQERAAIDNANAAAELPQETHRLDGLLLGPGQTAWRWVNGRLLPPFKLAREATGHTPAPTQVGDRSDRQLLPENALRIERPRGLP